MLNRIMLQGTVTNLQLQHDENRPSCSHQCFVLNFDDGLGPDSINVYDWTNAKIENGDKVLVTGCLMSNEKDIKDVCKVVKEVCGQLSKEWWVMLDSAGHDHSIIKLQEDSND